jgi:hypothetical protein
MSMPLKKLRVSFELDADLLCRMLVHGSSMHIEAFHQSVKEPKVHPALPPPRVKGARVSPVGMVVLRALADGKQSNTTLQAALEKAGFAPSSINSCIHKLVHIDKLTKRVSNGVYALTAKGRNALGEETE